MYDVNHIKSPYLLGFLTKKLKKTSILNDGGKNPKKDLYFRIINARMILH